MDTSSVQYTLREKDIKKAASLLELPEEQIRHYNSLNLLNTNYIRSLLMRADFEQLTHGLHYLEKCDKKYRYPEVVRAIAREYGISQKAASIILQGKDREMYFCTHCGVRISYQGYRDRGGLCFNCYADSLEMP